MVHPMDPAFFPDSFDSIRCNSNNGDLRVNFSYQFSGGIPVHHRHVTVINMTRCCLFFPWRKGPQNCFSTFWCCPLCCFSARSITKSTINTKNPLFFLNNGNRNPASTHTFRQREGKAIFPRCRNRYRFSKNRRMTSAPPTKVPMEPPTLARETTIRIRVTLLFQKPFRL